MYAAQLFVCVSVCVCSSFWDFGVIHSEKKPTMPRQELQPISG